MLTAAYTLVSRITVLVDPVRSAVGNSVGAPDAPSTRGRSSKTRGSTRWLEVSDPKTFGARRNQMAAKNGHPSVWQPVCLLIRITRPYTCRFSGLCATCMCHFNVISSPLFVSSLWRGTLTQAYTVFEYSISIRGYCLY